MMNGYKLTKAWFKFRISKSQKVRSIHSELYFYIVELSNILKHPDEFGLPTDKTMSDLDIGSYNTYKKTLNDLIEWKFIKLVSESKNQYQSKVIAISKNDEATDEATDKAQPFAISKNDEATDDIIKHIKTKEKTIKKEVFEFPENLNEEKKTGVPAENSDPSQADSQLIRNATSAIAKFFGISEMNHPAHFMKIGNFVRYLHGQGKIDYLRHQFKGYTACKADGFKHSWKNYLGSLEKSYEDGGWNETDWELEAVNVKKQKARGVTTATQAAPTLGFDLKAALARQEALEIKDQLWFAQNRKSVD